MQEQYNWRGEQFLDDIAGWARDTNAGWDALFQSTAVKALNPDNFGTDVLESTELWLVSVLRVCYVVLCCAVLCCAVLCVLYDVGWVLYVRIFLYSMEYTF